MPLLLEKSVLQWNGNGTNGTVVEPIFETSRKTIKQQEYFEGCTNAGKLTSRREAFAKFRIHPLYVCKGMDRNKRWEKVATKYDIVEFPHSIHTHRIHLRIRRKGRGIST